ncbi:aspartic proteinase CDR1-like [Prosopis cineraria]|uniref:aspartic proteinase CDR1-like n=1 Tax=Prosopis cineraria TaxID=364024 RepID=UPI00241030D2|nr:aspartic proteinase CDR1-like [Prosopis cineraria]
MMLCGLAIYLFLFCTEIPSYTHNQTSTLISYSSLLSLTLFEMTTSSSIPCLISFTIFFLIISTCVKSKKDSFVIEIIHRDSPKSPLFDNTTTHFQRFYNALLRSEQRMNYLFPNKTSTINNYDPRPTLFGRPGGEYVMQYSLGRPMFETYGIIDTGSDLTWLQCIPFTTSFDQGSLPYLDTNFNWGLHVVECQSRPCVHIVNPSVTQVFCAHDSCQCKYMVSYADDSTTAGDVFHTLLRLQTVNGDFRGFPMFIFGCSRETTSDIGPGAFSGIVGLGRGPASLVSQLYNYIDGKFAYCLAPVGQDADNDMRFGPIAAVSGPDVVYTPMIAGNSITYYHILMEGITVGDVYIPFLSGNTIVVTRLPERFYSFVEGQVARHLDPLYTRARDPGGFYSLCYSITDVERIQGPGITIHLRGGDLALSAYNIYAMIDDGLLCFNFKSYPADEAILGTMLQANFMVSYDLRRRQIAFKKMNCAYSHLD